MAIPEDDYDRGTDSEVGTIDSVCLQERMQLRALMDEMNSSRKESEMKCRVKAAIL